MKPRTAALLLSLAALLPASARIGETPAQLTARYGEPVLKLSDGFAYKKNGIQVWASLLDGKCYRIMYRRDEALSQPDVTTLLNANGGPGVTWADEDGTTTRFIDEAPVTDYRSSDKRLEAFHHDKRLVITHVIGAQKVAAAKEAADRANRAQALTGF